MHSECPVVVPGEAKLHETLNGVPIDTGRVHIAEQFVAQQPSRHSLNAKLKILLRSISPSAIWGRLRAVCVCVFANNVPKGSMRCEFTPSCTLNQRDLFDMLQYDMNMCFNM